MASVDDDPATRPRDSWPGHYPATLLLRRKGGPPWIARIFSSPADWVSRVRGDAEILRFLSTHDFPAERLACEEPVSVANGSGVIVTQFVEGGRPDAAAIPYQLGDLLADCTAFPPPTARLLALAAPTNPAVALMSDDRRGSRRGMAFLVRVEDDIAPRAGRVSSCSAIGSSSPTTPILDDGWPAWAVDRTDQVAHIMASVVAALPT